MPKGRPKKKTEYGQQLAEKQKIREEYGLRERQFRKYFDQGKDPDTIFGLLESRLDSVVFRAGFAPTRRGARQLSTHGHCTINGRRVDIPSYRLRPGDVVEVRETSRQKGMFADYKLRAKNYEPPSWLKVDTKTMRVEFKALPDIKEQTQPFQFQTVIEFYSR